MVAHQAEVELVRIPSGVHHQHSQKGPTSSHPNATGHIPDLNGTLGPLHRHHHFGAAAAAGGAAAAAAAAAAAVAAAVATAAVSDVFVCFSVSLLSQVAPSQGAAWSALVRKKRRLNRQCISTIPISRYHVANLSLETPTILSRHHIRIISKHTNITFRLSSVMRR